LLYYTGTSRLSSKIIEAQSSNVSKKEGKPLEAMHKLKEQAVLMKEALLQGELASLGRLLHEGWMYKKETSSAISNEVIDEIYQATLDAGATGGKISGAGGGGFMMFYCPGHTRYDVIESLQKFDGYLRAYQFVNEGLTSWRSFA
jgi:D-glycero-alpha-D-manno-heptose-7-phosphate kinase